uniref:Acyl-CoA thioesterase 11b n=1 Tax=Pygocentrus nattereri TaxID=42514 RepID=A0AAR2LL17_PYGNA
MAGEVRPPELLDEPELILEDGEVYRNPTEVKMSQIVLPCHANHCGELSVGQLLKWMDSTACLSAERHAGCSCITASVDDIHFEHTIGVGQVVNIKAKVNRAFTSSMEVGIVVSCEDLYRNRQWKVCHAFATFVARRTEAGKVQLKQVIPRTQAEQMEYSIAAERRRMRLIHAEIINDLLSSSSAHAGVATVDHLPPSCPIHCLLYFHTNHLHVHLHYIHKPSLRSTSSPSTRQLHLQHSLTNISTIPPQHMSKPSQPGLSGFISKLLHLHCPSDLLRDNIYLYFT